MVLDFDVLASTGSTHEIAVAEMQHRSGWYDPDVLAALRQVVNVKRAHVVREVKVHRLVDGMLLARDVATMQGTLLCAKGQEVTPALRVRLRDYVSNVGIRGPIEVFVPADMAECTRLAPTEPMGPSFLGTNPQGTGDRQETRT